MSDKQDKTFSLKPIEVQMLSVINEQHMAMLSNFFSYIALERLNYKVTEYTLYSIDDDGKLHIWEHVPEKSPVDVIGGENNAPAVADVNGAIETSALKGKAKR